MRGLRSWILVMAAAGAGTACVTPSPTPKAGATPEVEASPRTNMDMMQTIGSQLLDCRVKLRNEFCKKYGLGSNSCRSATQLDHDGIFEKIKTRSAENEFDVLVEAQHALNACRGIYE